jgi:hypothetical protein
MACKLTRRDDGVFIGKTGQTVEIGIRSTEPARIVRMTYAGTQDGEAPFTFKIQSGFQKLLVVAIGTGAGVQQMKIVEDPSGSMCHMKNFFWSPTHFHTTVDIEGN